MDKAQEKEYIRKLIVRCREASGLSQTRFAKEIGITQPQLHSWESGAVVPSSIMLVRLASYFGKKVKIA